VCSLCLLEAKLIQYSNHLHGYKRKTKKLINNKNKNTLNSIGNLGNLQHDEDYELKEFDEGHVDGFYIMIAKFLKSHASKANLNQSVAFIKLELDRNSLLLKEYSLMYDMWNRHLELLKVFITIYLYIY
jgi:hypothetical protein